MRRTKMDPLEKKSIYTLCFYELGISGKKYCLEIDTIIWLDAAARHAVLVNWL